MARWETPGDDSCPAATSVVVDWLEGPLGNELLVTGSKVLW
jgi:hypothetical protein